VGSPLVTRRGEHEDKESEQLVLLSAFSGRVGGLISAHDALPLGGPRPDSDGRAAVAGTVMPRVVVAILVADAPGSAVADRTS
jgi:hypothetical protein